MTDHIASRAKQPVRATGAVVGLGVTTVTFGSTAIASQSTNCGLVLTRTGVGTYTIAGLIAKDRLLLVQIISPALTVASAVFTADSATAGTATLKLLLDDAAADPAAADKIKILYVGEY
jgi:hypothetical protein